jgi:catechol 2,3-dioxygenase-like lactoylglutathione lyase family enzyme
LTEELGRGSDAAEVATAERDRLQGKTRRPGRPGMRKQIASVPGSAIGGNQTNPRRAAGPGPGSRRAASGMNELPSIGSRFSPMLSGFHHIRLNVTDLPRARAFYEGVLGFEVDQDFPGSKLRVRVGDSRARLVLCPPPGAVDDDRFSEFRIGFDHVSFGASLADIHRIADALAGAGVHADLNHDPLGGAVLCFRDPDNIALELAEETPPGEVPRIDVGRALRQFTMIEDTVAISERLGVPVWLRGGWAMDFFVGWLTRDHVNIDWFAWIADAPAIMTALHAGGYRQLAERPAGQRLEVAKDDLEMSFEWLSPGAEGQLADANGGIWPASMLDWPPGQIGPVQCPIISPHVQIECKEQWTTWLPDSPRRDKDATDVALLRQALP